MVPEFDQKPIIPEGDIVSAPSDEIIKLIIWDLDETFWAGTLSEEGIKPIQLHIDLVKDLSARGIVSSICSKNDFSLAESELAKLGIWDYFVFPKIAFSAKGLMVREIIEAAQLRAPSVLFIDDNLMNLNEALHYNPGHQIAEPNIILRLIEDVRCKGKPDPDLHRLQQYKILEQKQLARDNAKSDNYSFLKQSGIRISFHHDVAGQFTRIHDLVNRTNQLNFTKRRWPEDHNLAREIFEQEICASFHSHAGYIKVSDRYGNYGICGFYLERQESLFHFLFSCRSMNMGVEQFVWHKLGRPKLDIVGDVISSLDERPDWITVVDDADDTSTENADIHRPVICVRGACDLSMMTHYLRAKFDTVEEFPFPYNNWGIHPVARVIALDEEIKTDLGRALIERIPSNAPGSFKSAVNTRDADIYVISFSSELFPGLYRSRSTGIILPFHNNWVGNQNFANVSYDTILEKSEGSPHFSAADWQFMQTEFEYIGWLDERLLYADASKIFQKLSGKLVIVLLLNDRVGSDKWVLETFGKINSVIEPLAKLFGCTVIDMNDFVQTIDDLADPNDGGGHYKREIYVKLAKQIEIICKNILPTLALVHEPISMSGR